MSYHLVWEHVWVDVERARKLFGCVARALIARCPEVPWLPEDGRTNALDPCIYGVRTGFRAPFADKWLHAEKRPAGRPMLPVGYVATRNGRVMSYSPPTAYNIIPRVFVRALGNEALVEVRPGIEVPDVRWSSTTAIRRQPSVRGEGGGGGGVQRSPSMSGVAPGDDAILAAVRKFVTEAFCGAVVTRVTRIVPQECVLDAPGVRTPHYICASSSHHCENKGGEHADHVWFGIDPWHGAYQGCHSENTHDGVACKQYHRTSRPVRLSAALFSLLFREGT